MRLDAALATARRDRLYPSIILHGAAPDDRLDAALQLARAVLCNEDGAARPCGRCRHCQRIEWPAEASDTFHPDLHVLERDRATVTSVEATKSFLRAAQLAPFEARGQAFIIRSAETLSGEAANALLKTLEEPPERAPRHFFLLTPSQFDLLPTLRSRSLAVFLGSAERPDAESVAAVAAEFRDCIAGWQRDGDTSHLLAAASALEAGGDFKEVRAASPWVSAAAAVRLAADDRSADRAGLLTLALELLEAPQIRMRGIPARRILEGLTVRCLTGRGGLRGGSV